MFGRELKGRLPCKLSKQTVQESVQQKDAEFKRKCKMYANDRRRTKESNIRIGNKVLIEQDKVDGLSPRYNPEPFVVVEKKGSMVTVQKGETTLCRNTSKCKPLKHKGNKDSGDEWQPSSKRKVPSGSNEIADAERRTPNQEQRPTRKRISTRDTKYKDFLKNGEHIVAEKIYWGRDVVLLSIIIFIYNACKLPSEIMHYNKDKKTKKYTQT